MSRATVFEHFMPQAEARWVPASDAEREAVQQQLERILGHPSFKHSKRYPTLLRYVVEHTLSGEGHLKERTLGVEVFGREPGYDTNEDPVVRITAGEVRKRIAQYYHEAGHESELRIDLPAGSYVPEFHFPCENPSTDHEHVAHAAGGGESVDQRSSRFLRKRHLLYALVLIVSIGAIAWAAHLSPWASSSALDDFWSPVLDSPSPSLVVIGEPSSLQPGQENSAVTLSQYIYGPDHIAFSDANALFHLAEFLGSHRKTSRLQTAATTTLTDLRQGPVVLVAGFDNEWTLRLEQSLRYHFGSSPDHTVFWIEDRANPSRRDWVIDFTTKYSQLTQDYAIVSRFSDPTTGQPVVIAAGLGENGTIAAGEFLTSGREMQEIARRIPHDQGHKNIEIVLATQVIDEKSGPPRILAIYSW
jgi:hypothetical protein